MGVVNEEFVMSHFFNDECVCLLVMHTIVCV